MPEYEHFKDTIIGSFRVNSTNFCKSSQVSIVQTPTINKDCLCLCSESRVGTGKAHSALIFPQARLIVSQHIYIYIYI